LENCRAGLKNQGRERGKKEKKKNGHRSQTRALFSTRATSTRRRHQDEFNDTLE